jgi:hypothetical protein
LVGCHGDDYRTIGRRVQYRFARPEILKLKLQKGSRSAGNTARFDEGQFTGGANRQWHQSSVDRHLNKAPSVMSKRSSRMFVLGPPQMHQA